MASCAASSASSSREPPLVLLCRDLPTSLFDQAEREGKITLRRPESSKGPASKQWIVENVGRAKALVVTLTERVDEDVLNAAKDLQIVSSMSVGTDHIDVERLQSRGIKLGTTPDVLDQAVAELTLTLMLNVMRNVPRAMRVVSEGKWKENAWAPLAFCGPALQGKTVGFVGFGNIAQSVAALLPVFKPGRVLYTTSKPKPFSITEPQFARLLETNFPTNQIPVINEPDLLRLAEQSDVVVVLTTLNESTKHLIDRHFLEKMKSSAVLINTARGPVVDTDALVDALRHGRIWGAGLDVVEGEPNVEASHALLSDERCKDRVMVLPHIGSATFEARKAMADLTAQHVLDHF